MPDIFLARAMAAEEAGFVLAHLARDFVHDRVDRGVEIVGFFAGFDRDVIRADQDDLGPVPVFFDAENDVGLDDFRIIEMQPFDFARGVFVDRVGDREMAAGDFDGGDWRWRFACGSFRLHLKAFAEVKLAADRVVDQEIFRALAHDRPSSMR